MFENKLVEKPIFDAPSRGFFDEALNEALLGMGNYDEYLTMLSADIKTLEKTLRSFPIEDFQIPIGRDRLEWKNRRLMFYSAEREILCVLLECFVRTRVICEPHLVDFLKEAVRLSNEILPL